MMIEKKLDVAEDAVDAIGYKGAVGKPDQKAEGATPAVEHKTCRGCLTKGHLWANCPDNPDICWWLATNRITKIS